MAFSTTFRNKFAFSKTYSFEKLVEDFETYCSNPENINNDGIVIYQFPEALKSANNRIECFTLLKEMLEKQLNLSEENINSLYFEYTPGTFSFIEKEHVMEGSHYGGIDLRKCNHTASNCEALMMVVSISN